MVIISGSLNWLESSRMFLALDVNMLYKYGVKSPSQTMSNSSYFNQTWWTSISPYRTLNFESLTFWTCRVVQIGTWFLSFNVDPPWKSTKIYAGLAVWGHFRVPLVLQEAALFQRFVESIGWKSPDTKLPWTACGLCCWVYMLGEIVVPLV